jgi:Mitochondrial domain of unknown function (DUF1713)
VASLDDRAALAFVQLNGTVSGCCQVLALWRAARPTTSLPLGMGSLIKKRRKRMRKKKHKKMLKATRWQRRAGK